MPVWTSNNRTARAWTATLFAGALAVAVSASVAIGSTASAGETAARHQTVIAKKDLLETEKSPVGKILVDKKGRTVYVFMADKPGVSNCSGQCLVFWPAVVAPKKLPKTHPGITGKLGVIKRTDNGVRQLTVNGWPVYLFAGDKAPGQINGQGSNGGGALWWVVGPNGKKITTIVARPAASPSASPSASASSSASSSGSASESESPSASPSASHT
jgi:predicted lipoprotein with Yx(FWY)xxD motif